MASSREAQRRWRQEQEERGLCNYPGCPDRPEAGRKKCRAHLAFKAAQMQKYREERLAAGECQRCGQAPLVAGRKHCQGCLDSEAVRIKGYDDSGRSRSRYRVLRAKGLCTKCTKVPVAADSIYCEGCRERRRALQPSYDAARNRTKKARRADRDRVFFAHYGTVCKCCGQDWPIEMLMTGHVDDHGPADVAARRGEDNRKKFRTRLIEEGFPPGYMTLCANCHHAWWYSRCCPHARDRLVPETVDGRSVLRDPQTGKVSLR